MDTDWIDRRVCQEKQFRRVRLTHFAHRRNRVLFRFYEPINQVELKRRGHNRRQGIILRTLPDWNNLANELLTIV